MNYFVIQFKLKGQKRSCQRGAALRERAVARSGARGGFASAPALCAVKVLPKRGPSRGQLPGNSAVSGRAVSADCPESSWVAPGLCGICGGWDRCALLLFQEDPNVGGGIQSSWGWDSVSHFLGGVAELLQNGAEGSGVLAGAERGSKQGGSGIPARPRCKRLLTEEISNFRAASAERAAGEAVRFLMPQHRVNTRLCKSAAEPLLAPSVVFCRAVMGSLLVFPSQPRSRLRPGFAGLGRSLEGPDPHPAALVTSR